LLKSVFFVLVDAELSLVDKLPNSVTKGAVFVSII